MRGNPVWEKHSYRILYSACLAAGLLLVLNRLLGAHWPDILLAGGAFFFQLLLYWGREKKVLPAECLFLLAAHLGGALILGRMEVPVERVWFYLGAEAACILLAVLACAAAESLPLMVFLTLFGTGGLVYFALKEITLPRWGICAILFCLLFLLIRLSVKPSGRESIWYLTPLCCAALVVTAWLPVYTEPMQWAAVQKFIRYMDEKASGFLAHFDYLLGEGSGTYSLAGFGEKEEAGNGLLSSDRPQLTVVGQRTKSPLYLAGSIYNVYTGKGWEVSEKEKSYEGEEYVLQSQEFCSSMAQGNISEEDWNAMTANHTLTVRYTGIKTKSLFLPLHTRNIRIPGKETGNFLPDSPVLHEARGMGFSYQLDYTEADYAGPEFEAMRIRAALHAEKEDERVRYIRDVYTQLPSVPEEVTKLANEITAGCQDDYGRMKAIEAYLQGYTYEKFPVPLPKGEDAAAYFLLESREGYCTSFATAAAVLGRCVGVPTRYVEGFATVRSCNYESYRLKLTGNDAHAWTEAYISGIGWLPFDATPGYAQALGTSWESTEGEEPEAQGNDSPQPEEKEKEIVSSIGWKAIQRTGAETALLAAGLCLAAVLGVLCRNFLRKKRYEKKNREEKIGILIRQILVLGALQGFRIEMGETLEDYGRRLEEQLDTKELTFAEACGLYQRVRFGSEWVSADEAAKLEHYYRELEGRYLAACRPAARFLYYLR